MFSEVAKAMGNTITCVACGEVLTTDYRSERGHAESKLYTHVCPVRQEEVKCKVTVSE